MNPTDKIAANMRAFRIAVAAHDRENPDHPPAYGIGMAHFDLERLGFDEGETLWEGVTVHSDTKTTGNFRVLCAAEPDQPIIGRVEEVHADGTATIRVPA